MLDQPTSFSKRELKARRRAILGPTGALLLGRMAPLDEGEARFSAMQSVTTLIARTTLSTSAETAQLGHILAALVRMSATRKQMALGLSISAAIATAAPADAALTSAAFPSDDVKDEELAVAVLGLLVDAANKRFNPDALTAIRRFPPRLRTQVTGLITTEDGQIKADRADLLAAASVGAMSPSAFEAAEGKRDLLKRMRLPQAAARITPAGTGPISRYSEATFNRWSRDPQLYGLLDARSMQQRRQIEFVSRIASSTLAHIRITPDIGDAMIRWALIAAPSLPAGRFGAKYVSLVRWMVDSAAPARRGLRPERRWTAKISVEKALEAAAAHAETLKAARKGFHPFALPDDGQREEDSWPRGGVIGEGLSVRRLWTMSIVQSVGLALDNCLSSSPEWAQRHQTNSAAIFAILSGGEVVGALAVGRDMTGAFAIVEQGGPSNAPLPQVIDRAARKWVGQANLPAERKAPVHFLGLPGGKTINRVNWYRRKI